MRRLIALLLLATVWAQAPADVGFAVMDLTIFGNVSSEQTVYLPPNDARQAIKYYQLLDIQLDEYGNELSTVDADYVYKFEVTVNASHPVMREDDVFPIKEKENSVYTEDSRYVIVSDTTVRKKAQELTATSNTALDAISKLGMWVHENTAYDSKYWESILSSSEVFRVRKGVCDEYANLYAAMARGVGIPTRIVTGVVYTGSKWQRHAWAESKVGDVWVPVDATFGEIGTVNAMHVKLYHAPTYLYYLLPETTERVQTKIIKTEKFSLPLKIDVSVSSERVAPRSMFSLEAKVMNQGETILMPSFYAQKTVGIEALDDFKKMPVLYPKEFETLEWKFIAPYGERDKYFVIFSGPTVTEEIEIVVDESLAVEKQAVFSVEEVFAHFEENKLVIDFNVVNVGNAFAPGVTASVITPVGTKQESFELGAGDVRGLSFEFDAVPGKYEYEVRVESENGLATNFGTVGAPEEDKRDKGLFASMFDYFSSNVDGIVLLLIMVGIVIVGFVLFVPALEGPKPILKEKDDWSKLVKLKKEH